MPSTTAIRVAVLATGSSDLLMAPLRAALESYRFAPELWNAGHGQMRPAILDPASRLYPFAPDVVLLYGDAADLFQPVLAHPLDYSAEVRARLVDEVLQETSQLVQLLQSRLPQCLVLCNTIAVPPMTPLASLDYNSRHGVADIALRYNLAVASLRQHNDSVRIVDVGSLVTQLGFTRWHDPRLWCLARSPWSGVGAEALATRYAAIVAAERGRMRKCIVLDLDNVLWGGLAAEDGPHGVALGQEGVGLAYTMFQQRLLQLHARGVILAACSKNNAADAWAVIRDNPNMILREQHFAATRINWLDKATNIQALATELGLTLDALVFVDDSPIEREWVKTALPAVAVPDWPQDPAEYVAHLYEVVYRDFEQATLTTDDLQRGQQYHAEGERRDLATQATTLDSFYRSLDMEILVALATSRTTARIAQLTQKTNQFNLTTRRYSEPEIVAMSGDPRTRVFSASLRDRFGDSGLVGVFIARQLEPTLWTIDTFLLSCRVLGRTVEKAFMSLCLQQLWAAGAREVRGVYLQSEKNALVADFYPQAGFRPTDVTGEWSMQSTGAALPVPDWFRVTLPGA